MKKIASRIALGLIALILLAAAGFVAWASFPLGPSAPALQALEGGSGVSVQPGRDWIAFAPDDGPATTGLIFYPGGRVDYRSYSPALEQIASQGHLVVLVRMPLSLAVFGSERAGEVIQAFPTVKHWAIGGHSLGGAMAARYAYLHPDQIDGLVLWAAYPAGDNSLAGSSLRVVSVYGTHDQVASTAKREAAKNLLPDSTEWVEIEDGNHAQFGSYGLQPGDGTAAISPEQQWQQAAQASVHLLEEISQ
jgi:hypothetical protein